MPSAITCSTMSVKASTDCRLLEFSQDLLARFDEQHSTPLEHLLREVAHSISAHLDRATSATVEALQRELELRKVMASFLVVLVMGLASYALLMKLLSNRWFGGTLATVITAPILAVMTVIAVSWGRRSGLPPDATARTTPSSSTGPAALTRTRASPPTTTTSTGT